MANSAEADTICGCRHPREDESASKDSLENVPNIHEIDEEESEPEEDALPSALKDEEGDAQETKDSSDDESAYAGESFCSDESCDESEVTNVASGSQNLPSRIPVVDPQRSQSSKDADIGESRWKDESCSLSDEPTSCYPDRQVKPRRCRRWNMSFTDEEMRRIERENELLLRKIMAQQKPRHKILSEPSVQPRTSSSAINRKKLQKRIEDDNMLLLRRIQQAKSCVFANSSRTGCRLTFL
ncbi:cilia- and flagella-associated protein 97-like [Nylanderia fulva]|uniref:cilia- and flagella-associated protein 97-like n=1 Tax=Nylanderia fulva TaxID=613905 RepID=UPI0010FB0046|nr:cilia- and flagella-associated protein 97-like [Nylanderia fulva]